MEIPKLRGKSLNILQNSTESKVNNSSQNGNLKLAWIKKESLIKEDESLSNIWLTNQNIYTILNRGGKEYLQSTSLSEYLTHYTLKTRNVLAQNIQIRKLVCNDKIVHLLTKEGKLFSFGEDSQKIGCLGLGGVTSVSSPQLNPNLANCALVEIEMSESHCCCLDSTIILI